MKSRSLLAALGVALALPATAAAQTDAGAWNDPAVLDLVERAITRRSTESVDTALQNYAADARGYVYFLLDAPELGRQSLVRTDQVALEVYWRAPDQIRQRIVGLRERRELPVTRLYYYLDRMTVVQDNYGDGIVIADGDNVNDVPHPIAAGATDIYDFRLAESLVLRLPGLPGPVTVREVQVRPKDPSRPAVVGSVFLEAETGALVRMAFTFTPSAYVDPRLDYINVNLENGLWAGRYWLPYEQRLEIRRELPELDLPFGTVIRTRIRIGEYRFNRQLADWLFSGPHPITFLPEEQRRNFPFEQPIDAELGIEGIGQPADVEEIRREARAMLRERAISGLPRGRPGVGSVSDAFRYNRAEGVVLGWGLAARPAEGTAGRVHAGWAFGAEHPVVSASLAGGTGLQFRAEAFLNRPRDVGGSRPASGLGNSLGALFLADDWLDPFYADGAAAEVTFPVGDGDAFGVSLGAERQSSAHRTTTYSVFGSAGDFRAVRPIAEGTSVSVGTSYTASRTAGPGLATLTLRTGAGRLAGDEGDHDFTRVGADLGFSTGGPGARSSFDLEARAAALFGDPPIQELYLLGGRGTLPGFAYRSFGGDRFGTLTARASRELLHPWLRARAFAGLGYSSFATDADQAAAAWGIGDSGKVRASLGAGVGLFYDLLHVDLARGLGDRGRTQVIVQIQPAFWDLL